MIKRYHLMQTINAVQAKLTPVTDTKLFQAGCSATNLLGIGSIFVSLKLGSGYSAGWLGLGVLWGTINKYQALHNQSGQTGLLKFAAYPGFTSLFSMSADVFNAGVNEHAMINNLVQNKDAVVRLNQILVGSWGANAVGDMLNAINDKRNFKKPSVLNEAVPLEAASVPQTVPLLRTVLTNPITYLTLANMSRYVALMMQLANKHADQLKHSTLPAVVKPVISPQIPYAFAIGLLAITGVWSVYRMHQAANHQIPINQTITPSLKKATVIARLPALVAAGLANDWLVLIGLGFVTVGSVKNMSEANAAMAKKGTLLTL